MGEDATYLLDANVFIEAYRVYYGFDICPGYWAFLADQGGSKILSIDWISTELRTEDALAEWVDQTAPPALFVSTDVDGMIDQYSGIIEWVYQQSQFQEAAKTAFAQGADGWLVAYAKVTDATVVSQEVYRPEIKRRIPIPNVCQAFGVRYIDTFTMLRRFQARFQWRPHLG